MTDELKQPTAEAPSTEVAATPVATPATPAAKPASGAPRRFGGQRGGMMGRGGMGRGGGPGGRGRGGRPGGPRGAGDIPLESDYEEKNIEVARVTRVTKGGKRMRFRVLTVIGNRKGRVGYGLAKGVDVAASTAKATAKARKALMTVPIVNETIPHAVTAKFAAAVVLLKPAPKGSGIKAGGAVRNVLELAGVPNVVSKILGSGNKTNNVKATIKALKMLKLRPAPKAEETPIV